MPRAKKILQQLNGAGLDLLLTGHLHHAFAVNTLDVIAGAHRNRGIVLSQCGTTTSRRGHGAEQEKNLFNLIRLEQASGIHIDHWMYFAEDGEFLQVGTHAFGVEHKGK
jgi:hypothetical protein